MQTFVCTYKSIFIQDGGMTEW